MIPFKTIMNDCGKPRTLTLTNESAEATKTVLTQFPLPNLSRGYLLGGTKLIPNTIARRYLNMPTKTHDKDL